VGKIVNPGQLKTSSTKIELLMLVLRPCFNTLSRIRVRSKEALTKTLILSTLKNLSFWWTHLLLQRMAIATRGDTILIIVNFFIKFWKVTPNWSEVCVKPIILLIPNLTNGIYCGPVVVVRLIYTKDWTNSRELIISHTPMRLPERTECALITSKCKRNSEEMLLILFQTLTFYQMSTEICWVTIKN
jgi:hypothetical protein